MSGNLRLLRLALGLSCAWALSASAAAHDLEGLFAERSALSDDVLDRLERIDHLMEVVAARAAAPGGGNLEAVVERALAWRDAAVGVCFFDGAEEAWEQVAEIAEEWTVDTGVQLDFGPAGNRRSCLADAAADIRVSFAGSGYWSYVGTVAKQIPAERQTLNLSGMGSGSPLSPTERGTVLHEFGHALGFHHEHQSPASSCEEEFNWPYLYVAFGWPKEKVDFNMRRLTRPSRRDGLFVTAFDSDSIMLYALSPRAFKDASTASCYITRKATDISETDRAAMQAIYPVLATTGGAGPEAAAMPGGGEPMIESALSELGALTQP